MLSALSVDALRAVSWCARSTGTSWTSSAVTELEHGAQLQAHAGLVPLSLGRRATTRALTGAAASAALRTTRVRGGRRGRSASSLLPRTTPEAGRHHGDDVRSAMSGHGEFEAGVVTLPTMTRRGLGAAAEMRVSSAS